MKTSMWRGPWLAMVLCCGAGGAYGTTSCEAEAGWTARDTERHFVVLAGREGMFYDRAGPAFVMLLRTDLAAEEADVGAVGIYADEQGGARFGAVPPAAYEPYLREAADADRVMLRLAITGPQYERVLAILRTWDRRAREGALLYPDDIFMNNILLVKQATEALNRCGETLDLYALDWGLDDEISEHNPPSRAPLLYFAELRRRNERRHVADAAMPEVALTLAEVPGVPAEPAPAGPPATSVPAAPAPSGDSAEHGQHQHHHHHQDE